ncbi:hypothetical protein SAMD00019534_124400 [Acytostelium subglobosum LB1]|uniref:hypothetical protein n=1 Tax=Acytostelium subglobosum LB1 TaxID=1410327 RepID=UPI0006451958|nr:hypothetical protein SAMD00019534_124400 [Acytostelium subglobosum LB1]GAM29264.1 hypothetical protein SAMD00019534_124400 [Acytostelium subglobosum LB1]|eukprot:XP_012747762.1 hypothetical protein SAMD00019534_124400 [Acytostelium subglobosum LB1]
MNPHDIIYYNKAGRIRIEHAHGQDIPHHIDETSLLDPQRSLVTLGCGISLHTLLNKNACDKPDDNTIRFISLNILKSVLLQLVYQIIVIGDVTNIFHRDLHEHNVVINFAVVNKFISLDVSGIAHSYIIRDTLEATIIDWELTENNPAHPR